jgi:hypothetical protein
MHMHICPCLYTIVSHLHIYPLVSALHVSPLISTLPFLLQSHVESLGAAVLPCPGSVRSIADEDPANISADNPRADPCLRADLEYHSVESSGRRRQVVQQAVVTFGLSRSLDFTRMPIRMGGGLAECQRSAENIICLFNSIYPSYLPPLNTQIILFLLYFRFKIRNPLPSNSTSPSSSALFFEQFLIVASLGLVSHPISLTASAPF